MEVYGVIYLLIDGTNDYEYVGQTTRTVEKRFKEHAVADSCIGNAIRDHGVDMFVIAILKECYSPEELNRCEMHMIRSRNTRFPNGYNMTDGGEGGLFGEDNYWFGKHIPADACLKMAEVKRADTHYQNLLQAMIAHKFSYGKLAERMGTSQASLSMKMRDLRQFSQEDVDKLVEIFGLPAEYLFERDDGKPLVLASRSGENNPFFGKHHTGENKIVFSINNRGDSPYKNLRAEMDKRQISYRCLADLLGMGCASISRKMTGKRNFTEIEWANLSKIFGLPVEYLMERDDNLKITQSNRGKTSYKNLLWEITNQKLTYTALGELLGLSHQSVSEKMHGKKNFTAKDWAKLSEILGKPVEYLMARDN